MSQVVHFLALLMLKVRRKNPECEPLINTMTTFWHHQFLAACYQLAQSVLKIGSALAEREGQGEVGG